MSRDPSAARQTTRITILQCIIWVSFTTATALVQLPCEFVDGNPIPTLFLRGGPSSSTFQGFILSLMAAFAGAYSSLMVHHIPRIASACCYLSMISMTSAVAFLSVLAVSQVLSPGSDGVVGINVAKE
ncbi:hypothetical protein BT93_B1659 [Corymbia citriodora subsp. variegata]|nr:hypothetical protein BT93_B1659 [Corymbia citriodora subsp. variegata]